MPKAGPRKIADYGDRFKATAVKLSSLPGVQVKDVAQALDIHPFMLSLWRRQVRERKIVARASKLDVETTAELRRLRELERRYKLLNRKTPRASRQWGATVLLRAPATGDVRS